MAAKWMDMSAVLTSQTMRAMPDVVGDDAGRRAGSVGGAGDGEERSRSHGEQQRVPTSALPPTSAPLSTTADQTFHINRRFSFTLRTLHDRRCPSANAQRLPAHWE